MRGFAAAALALRGVDEFASMTEAKRNVNEAIKQVAARLGNTPSVCRKCYVHPAVLSAYMDGELVATLPDPEDAETAILALLSTRLARDEAQTKPGNFVRTLEKSARRAKSKRRVAA